MKLDGSEVRRLAHHRSRPFNSYNYQPHVSVSWDGSVLVYNSNFGLQSTLGYPTEYADLYLMAVPASSTSNTTGSDGTTGSGTGVPTPSSTTTVLQESDPAVSYAGSWYEHANGGHNGGGARLAMDAGARARVTFTGDSVTWTGYQDEWSGIARVYVDGTLAAIVDTYATPAKFRSVIFARSGLAPGSHTISIEATGTRSANSGGSWIWLDTVEFASAAVATTAPPLPAVDDSAVPDGGNGPISNPAAGSASVRGHGNSGGDSRSQRDSAPGSPLCVIGENGAGSSRSVAEAPPLVAGATQP